MSINSDMPALFGEEYQALRESVSALAQKKILPLEKVHYVVYCRKSRDEASE
mgnify:CR=1 FL=1